MEMSIERLPRLPRRVNLLRILPCANHKLCLVMQEQRYERDFELKTACYTDEVGNVLLPSLAEASGGPLFIRSGSMLIVGSSKRSQQASKDLEAADFETICSKEVARVLQSIAPVQLSLSDIPSDLRALKESLTDGSLHVRIRRGTRGVRVDIYNQGGELYSPGLLSPDANDEFYSETLLKLAEKMFDVHARKATGFASSDVADPRFLFKRQASDVQPMEWKQFSEDKVHMALFEIPETDRNFGILRHEATRCSFFQALRRAIKTVTSETIPFVRYVAAYAPFQRAKERNLPFDSQCLLLKTDLFQEEEQHYKIRPKNGGGVLVLVHYSQAKLQSAALIASQALKRIPADVRITRPQEEVDFIEGDNGAAILHQLQQSTIATAVVIKGSAKDFPVTEAVQLLQLQLVHLKGLDLVTAEVLAWFLRQPVSVVVIQQKLMCSLVSDLVLLGVEAADIGKLACLSTESLFRSGWRKAIRNAFQGSPPRHVCSVLLRLTESACVSRL